MGFEAMLTIDLKESSHDQREFFYKHLENKGWSKLKDVDTAWSKPFPSLSSILIIRTEINSDLDFAANKTGCKYEAWFLIGCHGESVRYRTNTEVFSNAFPSLLSEPSSSE
ncbi:hypothetical protein [Vibrio harveyi]